MERETASIGKGGKRKSCGNWGLLWKQPEILSGAGRSLLCWGNRMKHGGAVRAPGQARVEKQRTQAWDCCARCLPSALVHTQLREAVVAQGCYDFLCSLKICQHRLTDLFPRRRLFPGAPLVGGAPRACSHHLLPQGPAQDGG